MIVWSCDLIGLIMLQINTWAYQGPPLHSNYAEDYIPKPIWVDHVYSSIVFDKDAGGGDGIFSYEYCVQFHIDPFELFKQRYKVVARRTTQDKPFNFYGDNGDLLGTCERKDVAIIYGASSIVPKNILSKMKEFGEHLYNQVQKSVRKFLGHHSNQSNESSRRKYRRHGDRSYCTEDLERAPTEIKLTLD